MPDPGSNDPTIPISQARTASVPEAAPPPRPTLAHLAPGTVVSRYRVESVLGEGGMGTVYLARQEKPDRQVALKVVRPGYATERMLKRFELEAEVLGRLLHPGIAQIYEAGTADAGLGPQPFFAMELVKGVPLTRYAHEQKLTTRQRLELVAKVCDAVQHAHQKGVIHRDLKPGNILVTDDGQPKILDFGVARATDSDIQQTTMETDVGAIIGTIPYMSPEQVGGDAADLDTRSDVYALGVIAYELLAGRLPYSLERKMIHEAARIIREEEPTRLSSIDRALRGDVETIVAHALEKDKARRYGAASALAADIRRYLAHEPIAARPASAWYQLAKFSRRNRALVGGVAATFVALAGGIATTGLTLKLESEQRALAERNEGYANEQTIRAKAEAERARRAEAEERKRADELKQVAEFQSNMLAQVDPTGAGYRLQEDLNSKFEAAIAKLAIPVEERTARAEAFRSSLHRVNMTDAARDLIDTSILKPAVAAIDAGFKDQPLVDAQLRQVLANRYRELGMYDAAEPLQQSALAARRLLRGEEHQETLMSFNQLGVLLTAQGKLDEAETICRQVLEARTRLLGPAQDETITSLNNLGALLHSRGRLVEAEECFRRSVDLSREVLGTEHADTLTSLGNLGAIMLETGNTEDGRRYLLDALALSRRIRGNDDPGTIALLNNTGHVFSEAGRASEAEPYFREALERSRRVLGEYHPTTLTMINVMAGLLFSQGYLAQAEPLFFEALSKQRRILGDDHPDTMISIFDVGGMLVSQGRFLEAEPYWNEALERHRRVFGDNDTRTLDVLAHTGFLLQQMGRLEQAEARYREALDVQRRVLGDDHVNTLATAENLGGVLASLGNLTEAETLCRAVLEARTRILGEDHPFTITSLSVVGGVLHSQGKFSEAEALGREAMARFERTLGENHPFTLTAVANVGVLLIAQHRESEAEQLVRRAMDARFEVLGREHPDSLSSMRDLGRLLASTGRFREALPLLTTACERATVRLPQDHPLRIGLAAEVVTAYESWHRAEPGQGYDAKAAEWKAKLDAITPPPEPATVDNK